MFNNLKTFLFGEPTPQAQISKDSTDMIISPFVGYIREMKNGKFRLLNNGNELVGTYTRRRDAVRGAQRRGIRLAA